ncbi:hypothetical protein F485_gp225 [Aeromonas phage CC2]|uniref:Uncharacterized protein n=1 Tax=Aeromonas phage CC2 TaxID=1204516 RepID=I6WBA1_9CAUD|nr:hypothetical protein F485_gp225 [Aeromonas phage CC2]AFN39205.1 hypothetical protein CC2_070 [Aeromonas phage CC2]
MKMNEHVVVEGDFVVDVPCEVSGKLGIGKKLNINIKEYEHNGNYEIKKLVGIDYEIRDILEDHIFDFITPDVIKSITSEIRLVDGVGDEDVIVSLVTKSDGYYFKVVVGDVTMIFDCEK